VFACARIAKGVGPTHQSTIGRARAAEALDEAVALAKDAGIAAAAELVHGDDPARLLIDEGARADLLVVASHGDSRASGIMLGSTAAVAVHRATVPVLVARTPPEENPFPKRILVASDGSPDGRRALEHAARIGRRHHAHLVLLAVDPSHPGRLPEDALDLSAEYGIEPAAIRRRGHPDEQILSVARIERPSLVVVGSRGLTGLRALGSVSELVSQHARCSVLVVRPPGRRG
jgi:nucleotide-binding universal stress UspA family protein